MGNSKNDNDNSKKDKDNSKRDNNNSSKKDNDNSKKEDNNSKNDNDNSKKDKDNNKKDNNNHKPSNKPFQTIVMVMAIIVTGINAMVYNKEENGVIKIEINAKVVVEHSVRCLNFLIKEIHHLGIVIGLVVME